MDKAPPAFQFYPADWLNDIRLRAVSREIKGFLIDIMCLMHQSPKYGFLPKEIEDSLPRVIGEDRRSCRRAIAELESCYLLSRDEVTGELYNKRMVRDYRVRQARIDAGRKGGAKFAQNLLEQKVEQKREQNTPPSFSSSSSTSKDTNYSCGKVSKNDTSPPPVPILKIPLTGKEMFDVYQDDISQWQETFPGIDVVSHLRIVRQWNIDNPKNRKTLAGIRKHITGWLAKEQNKARRVVAPPGALELAPRRGENEWLT